jgi:hypothetical protein
MFNNTSITKLSPLSLRRFSPQIRAKRRAGETTIDFLAFLVYSRMLYRT